MKPKKNDLKMARNPRFEAVSKASRPETGRESPGRAPIR